MNKKTSKIVECDHCKNKMERQLYRLKKNKQNFCSWNCKKQHNNQTIKKCKICNQKFGVYGCRIKTAKYCSNQCKWKGYGENRKYKFRNSSYSTKDRKRTIKEYGNNCEICTWNEFVECHHIDGDRNNHNIENLSVLCPNHHTLTEKKYRNLNCFIKIKRNKKKLIWKKVNI